MTGHLSTLQVKQLCVSALPEDELAAAAIHTAECPPCHQRFVEELRRQRGSASFTFTLEPEFCFRNDHVDFDQIVAFADKTLDEETKEIINIHLSTCQTCREDVRSFLTGREASAGEMDISDGRPEHQAPPGTDSAPWWRHLQTRPMYAVAAIVLVAIAVLIGAIALSRNSGSLEARRERQTNPQIEGIPDPSPNVASSPSSVDDSTKVAVLMDAGGEVTIDKNGRVTGIDQVSENNRQYIARAALSERIEAPGVLRHLSGDQSGLRGNDTGPQEFNLLYPVRSVIVESRPVFRWNSLPGTSGYRVYVLDANGKQVAQSEEVSPSQTQWRTSASLPRGQVYSWVVTALVDGQKVVSPSASAPETKFAVLSAADFRELTRLKQSNSHLALGVFFARTGLLNEAEREFQSLIKLNPKSELPKKLLQSVRGINKKTN